MASEARRGEATGLLQNNFPLLNSGLTTWLTNPVKINAFGVAVKVKGVVGIIGNRRTYHFSQHIIHLYSSTGGHTGEIEGGGGWVGEDEDGIGAVDFVNAFATGTI